MTASITPLTIVLIGANGYTGRAVLRAATRYPDQYRVRAQARDTHGLITGTNIKVFTGSLEQVNPELFPDTPHVLVHAAAKNLDPDNSGYDKVNVDGTRALLANCNDFTRGIIFHSSLSVLGQRSQQNVSNLQQIAAETPLARSRAKAELLVMNFARQKSISAYSLRPRFILGKEDAFVIPALIKLVRKGLFIGNGQQKFSIIDADDYGKLILEMCQYAFDASTSQNAEQLALNVGYEQSLPFAAMFDSLQALLPDSTIKRRITHPAALATVCNWMPVKKLQSLATQLQLIGLDHYSDVSETRKRLRTDILSRDSFDYFRQLAQHFKDSPCN